MADTVKTIGSTGDYADPILWAAGQGGVNDGNRQVGEMLEDITINALFRPNQAFVNGGLLRGDITVTGEIGIGRVFTNQAASRFCLAPSANVNFEDFYASDGGVTKSATFQNLTGSDFTRFISTDSASGGTIQPVIDTMNTTLTNCVVYNIVQGNSVTAGSVTAINTLVLERMVVRANNLLTFTNSISLAADWYLGQPTDSGAVSLVNDCRILENANANEFGAGSSGNVVNYNATSDFVNYAGGDYRISSASGLYPLNIGPFFEASSGISLTVTSTLPSLSSSLNLSKIDNSFSIDANSTLPSLSSSLNLTSTDNIFGLSVSSELPSLTSILNLSVVNAGNNSSVNSFLPSLVSSLSLTKTEPAAGISINSELPSLISSLSLTVTNPQFDFSAVSTLPSLSSSLSLYNGVLGISVGDRNNINIVVKSTNINAITKSRNIEEY